jgi:sugar O-acyltransferase (sialic acid O-acetyltransferase NeuD family)
MSDVVIFGCKDIAQLASYYLETDSQHNVAAFTAHKEFMEGDTFEDKPLVPFEEVENLFPPDKYLFFAPMTGSKMSKNRRAVYEEAKSKGYRFISYISSKATTCHNTIGENCFILEDNTLQPFVTIGNNVVMWSGNHIGHHSVIKDHVFFTSHVVLSGHCTVEPHCWLGVNSTIRDGACLSVGTLVAMGSCLTKATTAPWSVYMGVPAKQRESKGVPARSDEVM